jgi:hypothetical protein
MRGGLHFAMLSADGPFRGDAEDTILQEWKKEADELRRIVVTLGWVARPQTFHFCNWSFAFSLRS